MVEKLLFGVLETSQSAVWLVEIALQSHALSYRGKTIELLSETIRRARHLSLVGVSHFHDLRKTSEAAEYCLTLQKYCKTFESLSY